MRKQTSIFLGLTLLLLTACKKDNWEPDTDPIAHYTFSGNADDQSQYKNNGIALGATLTVDSFGTTNSAYYFNDSSYIEIIDSDIIDVSTRLTISAWIKPSFVFGSYIVNKAIFVDNQGQLTQGGGPFSLDIFPGTARAILYATDFTPIILTGTTFIRPNVWQHLALTWDGSNAYLYYNGQIEDSGAFAKQILVTNGNLYIGAYKWAFPNAAFKGTIDNVRIYNRFLSTDEIQDLYTYYR